MKHSTIPSQRGVAAVEFAILVAAVIVPLYALLMLTQLVWQYNVLRGATATAARYLAMQSTVPFADREAIAVKMIEETTRNAGITLAEPPWISCETPLRPDCTSPAATSVEVVATTVAPDSLLPWLEAVGAGNGVGAKASAALVR